MLPTFELSEVWIICSELSALNYPLRVIRFCDLYPFSSSRKRGPFRVIRFFELSAFSSYPPFRVIRFFELSAFSSYPPFRVIRFFELSAFSSYPMWRRHRFSSYPLPAEDDTSLWGVILYTFKSEVSSIEFIRVWLGNDTSLWGVIFIYIFEKWGVHWAVGVTPELESESLRSTSWSPESLRSWASE